MPPSTCETRVKQMVNSNDQLRTTPSRQQRVAGEGVLCATRDPATTATSGGRNRHKHGQAEGKSKSSPGQAGAGRTLATEGEHNPNRTFRCTRPQHSANVWATGPVNHGSNLSAEGVHIPQQHLSSAMTEDRARVEPQHWKDTQLQPCLSQVRHDPVPVKAGRDSERGEHNPNPTARCTAMGEPGAHAGPSQPL